MFTVYVIKSAQNKIYIGQTADISKRLARHNRNQAHHTSNRGPWSLIVAEQYGTRSEAIKRERYLKQGSGWGQLHAELNEFEKQDGGRSAIQQNLPDQRARTKT